MAASRERRLVRSQRDFRANATILDGQLSGTVVTVPSTVGMLSAIDGFTILNGKSNFGAGVNCSGSSPIIANNNITSNQAVTTTVYQLTGGSGVSCMNSSPRILCNNIEDNTARAHHSYTGSRGVGLYCDSSSPVVVGNVIANNTALEKEQIGGGISCGGSSSPWIINNTIVENTAAQKGGGIVLSNCTPRLFNNIIAFNSSGVYADSAIPELRSNDVYGNTTYNWSGLSAGADDFSEDPLFIDSAGGELPSHCRVSLRELGMVRRRCTVLAEP